MNKLNINSIVDLIPRYGNTFYLVDADKLESNFYSLLHELNDIFPYFEIAYSYKTNYVPSICKLINNLGGYAEVVSDMEYNIAKRIGIADDRIIFNGPYKRLDRIYDYILNGGCINIDNTEELERLINFANDRNKVINIALRCNYDVNDGVVSRFGIDVTSKEFIDILNRIKKNENLYLKGLHAHIANRNLAIWKEKVVGMCKIIEDFSLWNLDFIDIGGGLYGYMPPEFQCQFNDYIPTYKEYAETIAYPFKKLYLHADVQKIPKIFIEPGSALVGDVMYFVCIVDSIKDIRNKKIATLTGSMYNINPTLNHKNPPIWIVPKNSTNKTINYEYDLAGFTCIESDYLYKKFKGNLEPGDIVILGNVGSYSIVLKPPFILPNYPVIQLYKGNYELVKRQEEFEDIFLTYKF